MWEAQSPGVGASTRLDENSQILGAFRRVRETA